MADAGTISSWVAAAISLGALGATVGRSWWTRPQVDWSLTGDLKCPGDEWLEGTLSLSNFGDGPAHRVTMYIRRSDGLDQAIATSPMVKPGDAITAKTGVFAEHYDCSHVWATWTPPPIRRRREVKSAEIRLEDKYVTLSIKAKETLAEHRE